jgi:hypothetical protein
LSVPVRGDHDRAKLRKYDISPRDIRASFGAISSRYLSQPRIQKIDEQSHFITAGSEKSHLIHIRSSRHDDAFEIMQFIFIAEAELTA